MVSLKEMVKNIPTTKKLYLKDSYLKRCQCSILRFVREKGKRGYIILDKSIFHPKYGGQPSDKGNIVGEKFIFNVKKVLLYNNVLIHAGVMNGSMEVGEHVLCRIDWNLRYKIMKLHTGGHILDYAMYMVYQRPVKTLSAFHGPPKAYLDYQANIPDREMINKIEKIANNVVEKNIDIKIKLVKSKELERNVINPPNLDRLPKLREYRIVAIGTLIAMPCTGTHLKNTGEISEIKVKEIEKLKTGFRLYYDCI